MSKMMGADSRDGEAEIKRASAILKLELPEDLQRLLIPGLDPGKATWVNFQYEKGVRGIGLDFRAAESDWVTPEEGTSSSSCCMDEGKIVADGEASKLSLDVPVDPGGKWVADVGDPGWPLRPCVRISKPNEAVLYLDVPVDLEPKHFRALIYCVEYVQRSQVPVPEHEIRGYADIMPGTSLAGVFSHIRRAFREAGQANPQPGLRDAAVGLVDVIFPDKKTGIGYRIGRPELFRFV